MVKQAQALLPVKSLAQAALVEAQALHLPVKLPAQVALVEVQALHLPVKSPAQVALVVHPLQIFLVLLSLQTAHV